MTPAVSQPAEPPPATTTRFTTPVTELLTLAAREARF
jgi:hypothetical protein